VYSTLEGFATAARKVFRKNSKLHPRNQQRELNLDQGPKKPQGATQRLTTSQMTVTVEGTTYDGRGMIFVGTTTELMAKAVGKTVAEYLQGLIDADAKRIESILASAGRGA